MSREEIDKICNYYDIENYTIQPDGSVDVYDDYVFMNQHNFKELPIRFGNVTGNFYCYGNELTSLEGSPHTVGGVFFCYQNKLTSLEHCPTSVGNNFSCNDNDITNLDFIPDHIGGKFTCSNNPIGTMVDGVEYDYLQAFKIYKVIKGDEVNLKRLKYVTGLFDFEIGPLYLSYVKKEYKIV
jgi:hypothetical protein